VGWAVSPKPLACAHRPATASCPNIRPDDFEKTLAAVEEAGGNVLIPKTDVMGYGWFAHFRDLDGNVIGLWQDAPNEG